MLNPKSDLYRSEWLELVFDDRNKSYGAYDLRKHYAETLTKALAITSAGFVTFLLAYSFFLTRTPAITHERGIIVTMTNPPTTVKPPHVIPPKQHVDPPKVNTVRYPPPVLASDDIAKNPPTNEEIKLAEVGQTTHKGVPDDGNGPDLGISDGPPAKAIIEDNAIMTTGTVEIMPAFPGGEAAWSKFLQKNLRYTQQAIDAGISGKVFISFVVEKDGHLSDITVDRGVGYGLDEESVRVLKLVPPWKPGIQNGRPVRVRYTMPISFQLPSTD